MKAFKISLFISTLFINGLVLSQMRPGLAVGMNFSTIAASGENVNPSTSYILGYHFRGLAEFVLTDGLSVEGGIGLSTKGFSSNSTYSFTLFGTTTTTEVEQNVKFNYLDIPLVLKYGIQMDEARIYAGVGPQFGFGMKGRSTVQTTTTVNNSSSSSENSDDINWKDDEINRVDLGAKALLGFERNGVIVEAFYEYGLVDLNQSSTSDAVWQNRCIGLTLGFKLGGY
jgi:hypothetical protein